MQQEYNNNSIYYLTLKLTNRCNLQCFMCGQVYSEQRKDNIDLPFKLVRKRLSEIDTIKHVYLFGGEPLLYNDFVPLIQLLHNQNIPTLITTNGTMLDKYTKEIINNKVRDIDISIDSHILDIFEEIRGKGIYNKVISNLENLIQVKKENSCEFPTIGISCVILPNNVHNLLDFYNFFDKNYPEINRITFELPILTTSSLGEQNEIIFKKELNCNALSWKWFYNKIPLFSEAEINLIYTQIKILKGYNKVKIAGTSEYNGIINTLSQTYSIPKKICDYPFSSLAVLPNADMTFCVDFPDYIIGNLNELSFVEAWNSERAYKFRNFLFEKGSVPICSRCTHRNDSLSSQNP